MRRIVFVSAAVFSGGIWSAWAAGIPGILWAVFVLTGICLLPLRRTRKIALALVVCYLTGGLFFLVQRDSPENIRDAWGEERTIEGKVYSAVDREDRTILLVESGAQGRICLKLYGENLPGYDTVGRWVRISGTCEKPASASNPWCFDYAIYLRSIGVSTMMSGAWEEAEFGPVSDRASHGMSLFRQDFSDRLDCIAGPENAALACALLFGDKSSLEESAYEEFQKNGTAHVLAVSGLHIGVLYAFLAGLSRSRRRPGRNLVLLGVLLFYGVLTGFPPSVCRGLLMAGIHIGSRILCRPYDLLTATGLSSMAILAYNPWQLFHTGFQLSFLAITAIGFLFPFVQKSWGHRPVLSRLLPMPALQLALAPYTAFVFNYFSFGAFIANYGVVFLAGLLVPVGFAAMVLWWLPGPLFEFAGVLMGSGMELLQWFNGLVYQEGRFSPDVTSPPVWLMVLFYGISLIFLSEHGRILVARRKRKGIAALLAVVLAVSLTSGWLTEPGFANADAVFVDVGQGDCLHIRTGDGRSILIDGGGKEDFDVGKKILKPYLLKNGTHKVDLALVTHLDTDHFEGIRSLAASGMVEKLGLYEGNRRMEEQIARQTGMDPGDFIYLTAGDVLKFHGVRLEVLYPGHKAERDYLREIEEGEENQRSLVIRACFQKGQILMTGDLDSETEEDMLRVAGTLGVSPEAAILKISHHGSRTGTGDMLLESVRPSLAVIQVGRNNYGHPSEAVLEKCRQKDIMVVRTDQQGAIGIVGLSGRGVLGTVVMKEP